MSETYDADTNLPHVFVLNQTYATRRFIDVSHVTNGPDDDDGLIPMVVDILSNLHRAGIPIERIQYARSSSDPDCIICVRSDRPDWHEFINDRDQDTGEGPQQADWLTAR